MSQVIEPIGVERDNLHDQEFIPAELGSNTQKLLDAAGDDLTMQVLLKTLIVEGLLFKHVVPTVLPHTSGKSLRNTDALRTLEKELTDRRYENYAQYLPMGLFWTIFKLFGVRNLIGHGFSVVFSDALEDSDIDHTVSCCDEQKLTVSPLFVRDPGGFQYRVTTSELAVDRELYARLGSSIGDLLRVCSILTKGQTESAFYQLPTCGDVDDVDGGIPYSLAIKEVYNRYSKGTGSLSEHDVRNCLPPPADPARSLVSLLRDLWAVEHLCRSACAKAGIFDEDFLITARQVLSDIPAAKKGRLWVGRDLSAVVRLGPDAYDLAIDLFLHPRGLRVHELAFHDPMRLLVALLPSELAALAELAAWLRSAVAGDGSAEAGVQYSSHYSTASRTLGALSHLRTAIENPFSARPLPERVASIWDGRSAGACLAVSALVDEILARLPRESVNDVVRELPLESLYDFLHREYIATYVHQQRKKLEIFTPVMKAARAALVALKTGPRNKALRKCGDLRSKLDIVAQKLSRLGPAGNPTRETDSGLVSQE